MAKGVVLGLVETLLREFCIESSAPPGSHDVSKADFDKRKHFPPLFLISKTGSKKNAPPKPFDWCNIKLLYFNITSVGTQKPVTSFFLLFIKYAVNKNMS